MVARSPVKSGAAERASTAGLDKHERPETVVFDLVDRIVAGRRLVDERRRERRDEVELLRRGNVGETCPTGD